MNAYMMTQGNIDLFTFAAESQEAADSLVAASESHHGYISGTMAAVEMPSLSADSIAKDYLAFLR